MKKIGQHKDTLMVHKGYDDNKHHGSSLFHCIRHRLFHLTRHQGENVDLPGEDGNIYSKARESDGTCIGRADDCA